MSGTHRSQGAYRAGEIPAERAPLTLIMLHSPQMQPTKRDRETWWLNGTWYTHSAFCDCHNWMTHFLKAGLNIPTETAQNFIDRWSSTGEGGREGPGTAAGASGGSADADGIDGLGEGELARLFAEDTDFADAPEDGER